MSFHERDVSPAVYAETEKSPWYLTLNEGVVPWGPGLMKGSHLQHQASPNIKSDSWGGSPRSLSPGVHALVGSSLQCGQDLQLLLNNRPLQGWWHVHDYFIYDSSAHPSGALTSCEEESRSVEVAVFRRPTWHWGQPLTNNWEKNRSSRSYNHVEFNSANKCDSFFSGDLSPANILIEAVETLCSATKPCSDSRLTETVR